MALGKRIPNVITSKRSVRACEREEAGIYISPCSGVASTLPASRLPSDAADDFAPCSNAASLHLMRDGSCAGGRLVSVGLVLSTRA